MDRQGDGSRQIVLLEGGLGRAFHQAFDQTSAQPIITVASGFDGCSAVSAVI